MTLEIILAISLIINIIYWFIVKAITTQLFKTMELLKRVEEIGKGYSEALDRENYLLKTMNDAMLVTDTKGFIAQRMKNAPKHWKEKTLEEVNPDNISG